jgi:hypothetical protein
MSLVAGPKSASGKGIPRSTWLCSRVTGQLKLSQNHFSGSVNQALLLLRNNPPADSGLHPIPNPGGLHPLLTEGGPTDDEPNSGVANKSIDRILELSADAAHTKTRDG